MKDLLKEVYIVLKELIGDEQCDHSVGVCWCDNHDLLRRIEATLEFPAADRAEERESVYKRYADLYWHKRAYSVGKVLRIVDMYLTGKYSQHVLAELNGVSPNTVLKILDFRSPYDMLPLALGSEKVAQLKRVRELRYSVTRLAIDDARRIKQMLASGHSRGDIARAYGVSRTTVAYIDSKKIWSCLDGKT